MAIGSSLASLPDIVAEGKTLDEMVFWFGILMESYMRIIVGLNNTLPSKYFDLF